jgi:PAS domain S-box-containing protein
MFSSALPIYIITAIISIAIAFLLAHLARLSAQAEAKFEKKEREMAAGVSIDGDLRQTIYEEISTLVDSVEKCQEVSTKLLGVVTKEVEKKISEHSQELAEKYETIIDEKSKREEMTWKKYSRVLFEKKQTESVIRSIAEGLVVLDAQGKVIMMNPAAEKLLGISRKDMAGKQLSENLKEEELVSLVKGAPEREDQEIELISKDDETKKVLRASSAVIESENGQTIGMVSVLTDITKQKELDRLKSSFVSNVSHELRTPIVAMEKSLSLLLSETTGEISETQEQFLSIADRNLKRLARLINDLLDLSKLEAGKLEIRREPCSIDKILNESIEALDNWAKTKSISIERRFQEGLPEVNIDPDRIIQVLTNLVGNAIKFTPNNGRVKVEAALSRGNNEIIVTVEDTGIGITKEHLTKIFDKFYQVGERVSTDIMGTGIGLSIAKEIVELHGGRIWAESEQGEGAKFIFTLPLPLR